MARIDFYVLSESGEASRQRFACRLAEKAYRLKHTVHIRTATRQQAELLDDLLWTFRDGSFVPHELRGAADDVSANPVQAPITIGYTVGRSGAGAEPVELLINLTDGVPQDTNAFPRVAEIVTSDDDCRRRSRQLFADYRSQGHSLESHDI
ncbi:MAG: DNA polymerase III subunit chi [Woeseia sp.]